MERQAFSSEQIRSQIELIKKDIQKRLRPVAVVIPRLMLGFALVTAPSAPAFSQSVQKELDSPQNNTITYPMEPKPEQDNLDLLTPTSPSSADLAVKNYSACTFNTGQPYPNDRAGRYSYTIINESTTQSPPSEALVNFQPFPYEAADSTSIPALNPGQSYPVSGVVDFNICTTCPNVNTHFFADFGESIVETDETNNIRNMITDTCSPQKKVWLPLALK